MISQLLWKEHSVQRQCLVHLLYNHHPEGTVKSNSRKRKMSSQLVLHLVTVLLILDTIIGDELSCDSDMQMAILDSDPKCSTRPTLINLKDKMNLEGSSDVFKMIPAHVVVERCGGSCHQLAHKCHDYVKAGEDERK